MNILAFNKIIIFAFWVFVYMVSVFVIWSGYDMICLKISLPAFTIWEFIGVTFAIDMIALKAYLGFCVIINFISSKKS